MIASPRSAAWIVVLALFPGVAFSKRQPLGGLHDLGEKDVMVPMILIEDMLLKEDCGNKQTNTRKTVTANAAIHAMEANGR